MKRFMTIAIVALAMMIGVLAAPASADVFVKATITKTVDITVSEFIFKDKSININLINSSPIEKDGVGEAVALANQENLNNSIAHGPGALDGSGEDALITISIDLTDSANDNQGVLGINQDIGNMVNQANLVSAAIVGGANTFADAQAEAEQINAGNTATKTGSFTDDELDSGNFIADKAPIITGSILGHVGAVGVNQNAGNMNNQLNALALAIGLNSDVALSEASLGQFNGVTLDEGGSPVVNKNFVSEVETVKVDTITGSINFNTGIVQVNQTSGNMNNQGSVISFSGIIPGVTALP